MPAYRTFDFMAQYRFKIAEREAQLQFNARNVFDKEYREGNMGGWGDPRNFLVSLSTKF
jgi:outer membrane receptor protein involved in Fe transport